MDYTEKELEEYGMYCEFLRNYIGDKYLNNKKWTSFDLSNMKVQSGDEWKVFYRVVLEEGTFVEGMAVCMSFNLFMRLKLQEERNEKINQILKNK
jgi:hypothetical protein